MIGAISTPRDALDYICAQLNVRALCILRVHIGKEEEEFWLQDFCTRGGGGDRKISGKKRTKRSRALGGSIRNFYDKGGDKNTQRWTWQRSCPFERPSFNCFADSNQWGGKDFGLQDFGPRGSRLQVSGATYTKLRRKYLFRKIWRNFINI